MSVKPGDNIPSQKLVIMDKEKGPQPFSLDEFCKEKKIVLFGVPGLLRQHVQETIYQDILKKLKL